MKHYTALSQLETEIYHLRENFALFDSVMEAHMNEFDKSQTPLGLSLWRLVELMRTNTEEIKDQFYALFDAIREESHEEETKASQAGKLITPWDHIVKDLQKPVEQKDSINLAGFGARESLMINDINDLTSSVSYAKLATMPIPDFSINDLYKDPNTFTFGTHQVTILTEEDIKKFKPLP